MADESKEAERWVVIAWLESFRAPLSLSFRAADLRHLESGPRDVRAEGRSATIGPMRDEEIIRRVEAFRFHAGAMTVERRNRGFTLIHVATGIPIARLRKVAGEEDQFDILYWSLCKERWVPSALLAEPSRPSPKPCASSQKPRFSGCSTKAKYKNAQSRAEARAMRIGINATCMTPRASGATQRFKGLYREVFSRLDNVEFVVYEPKNCAVRSWFDNFENVRWVRTDMSCNNKLQKHLVGLTVWPGETKRNDFDVFELLNLPIIDLKSGQNLLTIHDIGMLNAHRSGISSGIFRFVLTDSIERRRRS